MQTHTNTHQTYNTITHRTLTNNKRAQRITQRRNGNNNHKHTQNMGKRRKQAHTHQKTHLKHYKRTRKLNQKSATSKTHT